jgi:hypothetical protein
MAMNYETWLERLQALATELQSRDLEVELEIGLPTSEEELGREEAYFAQGTTGFRFHQSLRALYKAAQSVSFRWQRTYSPDRPAMFGSMSLAPLAMLYESESHKDPAERWCGVWRTLDETSAVSQVVVRFDESGAAVLGWRSTEGNAESITPLTLDLDDYFDLTLAACCLDGWPLMFAQDRSTLTREQVDDLLTALREIAPPANPELLSRARGTR